MRKLPKVLRGLLRSLWIYLGCGLAGALILSGPAYANSWPPMAIFLFHMPMVASLAGHGLGLLGILMLEAYVLHRREQVEFGKAVWSTASANLVSLIEGLLITFMFSSLPYITYGGILIFLLFFLPAYLFLVIASNSLLPTKHTGIRRLWLVMWAIIWLVSLTISFLVLLKVGSINPAIAAGKPFPDPSVPFYINLLQVLAILLFLILGFTMSLVTEAFVLSKIFKNRTKHFLQTVLIMNVRSYSYIAIPITLFFLSPMLRRLLNFQF